MDKEDICKRITRGNNSPHSARLTTKNQQQKDLNKNLESKNVTTIKRKKIDSWERTIRSNILYPKLSARLALKRATNQQQNNLNENLEKLNIPISLTRNQINLSKNNTRQKIAPSRVSLRLIEQEQKKILNKDLKKLTNSTSLKRNTCKSNPKKNNSTEVTNSLCHSNVNKSNKTETKCVNPANGLSTLIPEDKKKKRILNDLLDRKTDIVLLLSDKQKSKNGNKYKENLKPRLEQLKMKSTGLTKNEKVICKGNTRKKNSPNVTDELTLENVSENEDKRKYNYSTKPCQIFSNSTIDNAKARKMQNLLNRSNSFEEYGLLLPSYEKIMDNIKIMRKEAEALDTYEELYRDLDITLPKDLKELINNKSISQTSELLDCNHLSDEEMNKYFFNNLDHFRNIFEGKIYSERHAKYKNFDPYFDFTYSTSTVIYTEEQKDHLLMLLEKNFDPEGECTQYFFKVLLPEVCLKIFMDVYNKTKEEAISYLDWRPVE